MSGRGPSRGRGRQKSRESSRESSGGGSEGRGRSESRGPEEAFSVTFTPSPAPKGVKSSVLTLRAHPKRLTVTKVTDDVAGRAGVEEGMAVVGYGNEARSVGPAGDSADQVKAYLKTCQKDRRAVHLRLLHKAPPVTQDQHREQKRQLMSRARSSQSDEARSRERERGSSRRASDAREDISAQSRSSSKKRYDELKSLDPEGYLAKKAEAKRHQRKNWTEEHWDVHRTLNAAKMMRWRRGEAEDEFEDRMTRTVDEEVQRRRIGAELDVESKTFKLAVKAMQKRQQSGLDMSVAARLGKVRREAKEEAKAFRALKKEEREAEPLEELEGEALNKAMDSLRSWFKHNTAASKAVPCISCNTLVKQSNTQGFRLRNLVKVRGHVERLRGEGERKAFQLECLEKSLTEIEKRFKEGPVAEAGGVEEAAKAHVCKSCWTNRLYKGVAPPMGGWNNLEPVEAPPYLKGLGEVEQVLVAQRLPLIKLLGLNMGGQYSAKGGCTNLINQTEVTMKKIWAQAGLGELGMELPNTFSKAMCVGISLKRKLEYKSVEKAMLVKPHDLMEALKELKLINHFYADVMCVDVEEWRKEARADDAELFEAIVHDDLDKDAPDDEEDWDDDDNPLRDVLISHVDGPQVNIDKVDHFKDLMKKRSEAKKKAQQPKPMEEGKESSGEESSEEESEGSETSSVAGEVKDMSISEDSSPTKSPKKKLAKKIKKTLFWRPRKTSIKSPTDEGVPKEETPEAEKKRLQKNQEERKKAEPVGKMKNGKRIHEKRIEVAPGEGQIPLPLYMDEDVEPLAFPRLFPNGRNHFNDDRDIPISQSAYFKNRLNHLDSRFRKAISYIFFAFYKLEFSRLISSVNVSLNKGLAKGVDGEGVTAGALRDAGSLGNFIAKDSAFRFLQRSRGSPAFWRNSLLDLLGMVRMLGHPTWFLTLSADDRHWPEVMGSCFEAEYGRTPSAKELDEMPNTERNKLLRNHPNIPAQHFHVRVQNLKKLFKCKWQPLGEVTDYYMRYEWQQRGSPHVHCLLWVKDAPKIGQATNEEVEAWVSSKASGQLPDQKTQPELYEKVLRFQQHHHRQKCQRKGVKAELSKEDMRDLTDKEKLDKIQDKLCRYCFPRPVMEETKVVFSEKVLEGLKTIEEAKASELAEVREEMTKEGASEAQTAKALEEKEAEYELKRLTFLECADLKVELKRSEEDVSTNNYCPAILNLWDANMDIQFITNPYAAILYVCGYVAKAERQLSDEVKAAAESVPDSASFKQKMRKITNAFIRSRQISAQECIHNLLGLPYVMKSRQVSFLPSGMKEDRFRMTKSKAELAKLPEGSDDVFLENIIEKYERRTSAGMTAAEKKVLEEMPLAMFAASYQLQTKKKKEEDEDEADQRGEEVQEEVFNAGGEFAEPQDPQDDASEDEGQEETDKTENIPEVSKDDGDIPASFPKRIVLESGRVMGKRRFRQVIRSHRWDPEEDAEKFAYSTLLFYLPFRNEDRDLNLESSPYDSYQEWLAAAKAEVEEVAKDFEGFAEIVAEAFTNLEDNQRAAKMEQDVEDRYGKAEDDGDDEEETTDLMRILDPEDLEVDAFDGVDDYKEIVEDFDVGVGDAKKGPLANSKEELLSTYDKLHDQLNPGQRAAEESVASALEELKKLEEDGRQGKGKAFFLSGPGGVGKSHLIKVLGLKAQLMFHKELDDLVTVVTATTGTAAILVDGMTLHSGFSLPIMKDFHAKRASLSAQLKERMRNRFKNVRLIVVDEVSMLSAQLLNVFNERLNELFAENSPDARFGGKVVVFSGDLFQLRPVGGSFVFDKKGCLPFGQHIWLDEVELLELTQLMRSKDDLPFSETMLRCREQAQTKEDNDFFLSRTLQALGKSEDDDDIREVLHVYPTNDEKDKHNRKKMDLLLQRKRAEARAKGIFSDQSYSLTVHAQTTIQSSHSKKFVSSDPASLAPKDPSKCGSLEEKVHLVKGMRLSLRRNIDVPDRLANGSTGILRGWILKKDKDGKAIENLPRVLIVEFDSVGENKPVGAETKLRFKRRLEKEKNVAVLREMAETWGPRYVPVPPSTATFSAELRGGKKVRLANLQLRRKQFAVSVAFACTVHRVQGSTHEKLVISLGSSVFQASMAYTALSRLTSQKGLFLKEFHPNKVYTDHRCFEEMNRLRVKAGQSPKPVPTIHQAKPTKPQPKTEKAQSTKVPDTSAPKKSSEKKNTKTKQNAVVELPEEVKKALMAGVGGQEAVLGRLLPEEHYDTALWLINNYTSRLRPRVPHFRRTKLPELQRLAETKTDEVAALLRFLRQLEPLTFREGMPQGRKEIVMENELYPGLREAVKLVETTGDGSCMYNAVSQCLVGEEGLHRLLRALTTYALVSWRGFFLAFFVLQAQEVGEAEFDYQVVEAFWLGRFGEVVHQTALSIILARDLHVLKICGFVRDGRWKWYGEEQFHPEDLGLQALHDLYARREDYIAGFNITDAATIALGRRRHTPIRILHEGIHYTAVLPNPTADPDLIPVPFQSLGRIAGELTRLKTINGQQQGCFPDALAGNNLPQHFQTDAAQ